MSFQFYTTENNPAKLKEHILEQMKAAGAEIDLTSEWMDSTESKTYKKLAQVATESIIEVQKRNISNPLAFATAVRAELVSNKHKTMLSLVSVPANIPIDDIATNLTGVNSSGHPTPLVIKNRTVPSFLDELHQGYKEPAAPVIAVPTLQHPPSNQSASKPLVLTDLPKKFADQNTTQPSATATTVSLNTSSSTTTTPPTKISPPIPTDEIPAAPKTEFEQKYLMLAAVISASCDTISGGIKAGAPKEDIIMAGAKDIQKAITTALKPELQKNHVKFDDKDLAAVADITSQTIVSRLYTLKKEKPDLQITDPSVLQQQADTLGAEIHDALAKASKEKKLGKLSDGMLVSYVDILSGMDKSGMPTARNGTNFHTLGATALAQAFGSEAVQEAHKKNVARQHAKDAFIAQGNTLDSSSINNTIQTTLGSQNYADATVSAVQNITKTAFMERDVFEDTKKAWTILSNRENAEGKNGFLDVIKRFLMFVDSLLEGFTGFSLMKSMAGTNNPLTNQAKEVANHRHIKATYEAIVNTSPADLGYVATQGQTPAEWRQKLAETTTGVVKVSVDDYRPNGRESGLFAAINGLDADGTAQGMDISNKSDAEIQKEDNERKAQEAADKLKQEQKNSTHPESDKTKPPSKTTDSGGKKLYAGR